MGQKKEEQNNLMEKIVSLCKRRGFVFPGSEIYGGLANSWDYGPLGVALKNNIKQLWWKKFVEERDDMVGLDSAIIMSPKVWEASGHVKNFKDLSCECKSCNNRVRVDQYLPSKDIQQFNSEIQAILSIGYVSPETHQKMRDILDKMGNIMNQRVVCPTCGKKNWTAAQPFDLMMSVTVGAVKSEAGLIPIRPETAQGIFINFKNILDTTRKTLPFGVAQIGKAFRNEITPGNFIFRTREFEQMEIEYFIPEPDPDNEDGWRKYFEMWQLEMMNWIKEIGIHPENIVQVDIPDGERAHYSRKTVDFEYQFPFGQKELYGLAYRTDFDLKNHEKASGANLKYKSADKEEAPYWPPVIEPSLGVDRMMLAVLLDAYDESDPERIVLKLKPKLAPYKAAVFPLLANKPELVAKAREIYDLLRHSPLAIGPIAWDDRGNIGKRYYSQDEIGTPYCVTVDFESLENNDATIRDRDTAKQERVKISELANVIREKLE